MRNVGAFLCTYHPRLPLLLDTLGFGLDPLRARHDIQLRPCAR